MEKQTCGGGANTDDRQIKACCGEKPDGKQNSSCCGEQGTAKADKREKWITGYVYTAAGLIPQVATTLDFSDTWGTWKARWDINRMDYKVDPGLYCVDQPHGESPVLVSANYKMSFDKLRRELSGLDAWIMVLDTKGVNVWCAAGKGTFGTQELIQRIETTQIAKVVAHRKLILPQLGATGVQAHEVAKQAGFKVVYGPIRAKDIRAFIAADLKATPAMRRIQFTTVDRLVLTPVEVVAAIKPIVVVFGVMFILNTAGFGHYGFTDLYALLGAVFTGCVLTPLLLPWIPGRAFSFKGFLMGFLWALGVNFLNGLPGVPVYGWLKAAAFMLVLPAISSYLALNYTGTSTYTSLTGVDKEMKFSLPAMIIAAFAGIVLLIVQDIVLLAS